MRIGKRIAALALSMVVALGSVCYKPPKAEAVVLETAALVSASLSTYLSATGFSITSDFDGININQANQMIFSQATQFFSEMGDAIAETEEEFYALLCEGAEFATNGVVNFSASAADILSQFSAWFIDKLGLIGEDGVPVGTPQPIYASGTVTLNTGATYPLFVYTTETKDSIVPTELPATGYLPVDGSTYYLPNGNWIKTLDSYEIKLGRADSSTAYASSLSTNYDWAFMFAKSNGTDGVLIYKDGVYNTFLSSRLTDYFGTEVKNLSVSIPADYEAPPKVEEQYAMVVDTGLTAADAQALIDSITGGFMAGTLSPTYTIEQTTTGDVAVPDEGEDTDDTQVSILSWTKKIWQSVTELPQSIADAVANVFVPSAEYMAALPGTVTDTFASRTGFLTYPVSVLYDFSDRLLMGSDDFILEWPDVKEPTSKAVILAAGEFNVSKFVRDNDSLSDVYIIYQYVVGAYLTFLFLGLCRKKYNSVVGDRLGG